MRPLRPLVPVLLLAALTGAATPVSAQWLQFRRGPGLLRIENQGGVNQVQGNQEVNTVALRFDERLQLSGSGWLIDPRILNFTATIMPTAGQHTPSIKEGMGRGQSMAFDASTLLFPRRRISITARTSRTSGFNAAALGSRSEWVGRTTNLGLNMRDRYFPVRVTWSESDGTSTWRSVVGQPFELAQSMERFMAEVVNPKLTLRFRR